MYLKMSYQNINVYQFVVEFWIEKFPSVHKLSSIQAVIDIFAEKKLN